MMTLSYEKPVLVSDLPPLTEVINDKDNGYVFKSEDSNNLAHKLNIYYSELKNYQRFLIKDLKLRKNLIGIVWGTKNAKAY